MIIWIAGCAIADYVLQLEANSWRMLWGYAVASFADEVANKVANLK